MKDHGVTGKALENAMALAELIGAPESTQYRWSCYNGVELYWFDQAGVPSGSFEPHAGETMRIVTYVDGIRAFAYTKNPTGLEGDWQKVDYWFLYV